MKKLINKYSEQLSLLIMTLFLFLPFSNKAFHMDSPVTIYGAKQISENFINPSLGDYGKYLTKWNKTGLPEKSLFRATPHPPLILIYLSPFIKIFGEQEFVLNFAMYPFYFLSVLFFYLLLKQFFKKDSFWLSIIFALSPAVFVNSQNVMLDTPLMALTLISLYFLFKADNSSNAFWAGFFAGLACLIKITAGTLFFSAFVYYFIKKDLKKFLFFIAPFITLNGLWITHNLFLYGRTQLISNEHAHYIIGDMRYRFERMISFIGGGWIFPFIPIVLFIKLQKNIKQFIGIASLVFFYSVILLLRKDYSILEVFFNFISLISGIILIYSFITMVSDEIDKSKRLALVTLLILQLVGGPFLTLYAVRYTLPFAFITIITLQMMLIHTNYNHRRVYLITAMISLAISFSLSISDYQISGANKNVVKEVAKLKTWDKKLYYQGRLGYLYYMYNAGFIYFEKEKQKLENGDLLLRNHYFSGDRVLFEIAGDKIEKITEFNYPLFPIVTKGGKSGFYGYDRLPYWYLPLSKAKRTYTLYRYIGD